MEPTFAGTCAGTPQTSCEAAVFLDELQQAHHRVLELLASAATRVPPMQWNLAAMAGVSARLTRQWFDAQRMVLQREAKLDERIRQIETGTRNDALAVRSATARALQGGRADSFDLDAVMHSAGNIAADVPGEAMTIRTTIASLGTEVLRTIDDAAELQEVLKAAFAPDEPEWEPTATALTSVLESWWSGRGAEHEQALADAGARRRLDLHLVNLECQALLRGVLVNEGQTATEDEDVLAELDLRWADDLDEPATAKLVAALDGEPLPDIRRSGRTDVVPSVNRAPWRARRSRRAGAAWAG